MVLLTMKKQFLSFLLLTLLAFGVSAQTDGKQTGAQIKKDEENPKSVQGEPKAELVDEFGTYNCEDIKARVENFQIILNDNPKSRGVVFVYEGKSFDNSLPAFGESVFRTREMQKILTFYKFPMKNWLFINGGFRENFTVEFWLVPNGAEFPKPTPTLETIKYRKGAPKKTECGGS